MEDQLREVAPGERGAYGPHDDVGEQGVHDRRECATEDEGDGQGERVRLEQECFEFRPHGASLHRAYFGSSSAGWVPVVRPRAPGFVATWTRTASAAKRLTVQSDWRRLVSTLRGRVLIARNQGKAKESAPAAR